jgi:hypothetical protein
MKSLLVAVTALLSVGVPCITRPQPLSPLANLPPEVTCPLARVAMVRGSDSEAREGGGFYATGAPLARIKDSGEELRILYEALTSSISRPSVASRASSVAPAGSTRSVVRPLAR